MLYQGPARATHRLAVLLHPRRNKECLSLGCDEVPLFWGRTPVDMYRDFVDSFADAFDYLFGGCLWAALGGGRGRPSRPAAVGALWPHLW
jgi:hypothetical protein